MARHFIASVLYELRIALRIFTRDRRFTLAALAAIALGVGGSAAIFSVADRSLFRALPYRNGDRLVSVGVIAPLLNQQPFALAGMYRDWRSQRTPFAEMTSWKGTVACDEGDDNQRRLNCAPVESSFLPVLGVEPLMGRNLTSSDDQPGAPPVAIISYRLWQEHFGAIPGSLVPISPSTECVTRWSACCPRASRHRTFRPPTFLCRNRSLALGAGT